MKALFFNLIGESSCYIGSAMAFKYIFSTTNTT